MANLFAEPEALEALAEQIRALAARGPLSTFRAWVPGCATGEDAYACALVINEAAAQIGAAWPIKVFATDADPQLIAQARAGAYPPESLEPLTPARRRFFTLMAGGQYRPAELIRESIVFATHQLLDDPPFAQLDLVVCRELFAALEPGQRARALDQFAFALRPGGIAMLGAALSDDDERFHAADSSRRIFLRSALSFDDYPFPARGAGVEPLPPAVTPTLSAGTPTLPTSRPALIVDGQLRIVSLGAGVERLLEIQSGEPSLQLLDVLHPHLRAVARATIDRALARGLAAESPPVPVTIGATTELVSVVVQSPPEAAHGDEQLLVVFDKAAPLPDAPPAGQAGPERSLMAELAVLRDQHVLTLAQYQVTTEELRTTNEELRVANEELRVANEELQLRQEELQSLNDELRTMYGRQQRTLAELSRTNADLQNLMASTDVGTLFLDRELRIKRFTPQLKAIFNLIPDDLGRPLAQITHQLEYPGLLDDARLLLDRLTPIEREIRSSGERWFRVRLQPYLIAEHRVDGVVLTFLDISERRWAEQALQQSHADLERRVRERTAELAQAYAARQTLLRELVQAQERERQRIARDLHDQLGQQITAILLGLRTLQDRLDDRDEAARQLEQMRGIAQVMGREMHELAVALRQTSLDDIGLAEALQGYAESWARRTGIAVEIFLSGTARESLPADVATAVYRVALEALTNVFRHAEATRVNLILERHDHTLVTVIEDNGRGFDVEAVLDQPERGAHLGLLGMQERAALVGGTVSIESAPESGTTVILRIPLGDP